MFESMPHVWYLTLQGAGDSEVDVGLLLPTIVCQGGQGQPRLQALQLQCTTAAAWLQIYYKTISIINSKFQYQS